MLPPLPTIAFIRNGFVPMFGDFVGADDDSDDDRDEVAGDVIGAVAAAIVDADVVVFMVVVVFVVVATVVLFIGFKFISLFGRHFGNRIEIFSFKLDDESNFCTVAALVINEADDAEAVAAAAEM